MKRKFITLCVVDIQGLEEEESSMGFSNPSKRKKKTKTVKPVVGELIVPLDSITHIISVGNETQVSTLTNSFMVMNSIDEIKSMLSIKKK